MSTVNTVSTKPYLVRAIYEWCVDQGFSPHIAALVDQHVMVPPGYARDGRIVLDISPEATNKLVIGNEEITFQARFGGAAHSLLIPLSHVLMVYAGENGHGMSFDAEPDSAAPENNPHDLQAVPAATPEKDGEPPAYRHQTEHHHRAVIT